MTEAKPIYSGEATLRGRGETDKSGRWIRLEIEDFGGVHPFKGYEGERFAVVVMGPLATAEHGVPREGKAAGGGTAPKADTPAVPTRFKQRWSDLRPSARAALLTKDRDFQEYITRFGYQPTEADADHFVKGKANIESKRDLDLDTNWPNLRMFLDMESNYRAWVQAKGHGAIA